MENATAKVTKQVPVPCSEKSKLSPCLDYQALQYKCTECRHREKKENDVINQIKNKLRLEHRFQPLARTQTSISCKPIGLPYV